MKHVLEGDTFETAHHIGQRTVVLISERVSFIPAKTINCTPPYIKGKIDGCWVKYRKGERPKTKREWENAIGMELLPLTE